MSLFIRQAFTSHAGLKLAYKIECDALTDEDVETLASIVASGHTFSSVIGVPRGGLRLAAALEKYRSAEGCLLIVDDVLTTGRSMEEARAPFSRDDVQGVVIFARSACPPWVRAIFHLSDWAGP
jgi:orotate phosphoribosyltransferase